MLLVCWKIDLNTIDFNSFQGEFDFKKKFEQTRQGPTQMIKTMHQDPLVVEYFDKHLGAAHS